MSKYTKSAKGQDCQIRIPGICNFDRETTVFCHYPHGSGWATKFPDIIGTYGCSDCHDVIDGRVRTGLTFEEKDSYFLGGMIRTQILMVEQGILKL